MLEPCEHLRQLTPVRNIGARFACHQCGLIARVRPFGDLEVRAMKPAPREPKPVSARRW